MSIQLHKRLPQEFIVGILEAFNDHRIGEDRACQVLGLGRAQLYKLRRRWLSCVIGHHPFTLYARKESAFHRLPEEVERWLHEELGYIQRQAKVFRGRFNFAVLAEEAQKVFGHPFHRETLRYFALRHGYYHAQPEEKRKVFVRFETPGPGFLFQHDASKHRWVPALEGFQYVIATKDDYSRLFVGAQLVEKESSFAHLETARRTIEQYGRPQAYYVDQNKVFWFVEHHGVHVRYTLGLDEGEVQFKRALRSLDIGLIYAEESSPESKGKIDKSFDYLQRRVPYLCERHHIRTLRDALPILQEEVQFYNEKHVHIPDKGQVTVRYYGLYANAHRGKVRKASLGPSPLRMVEEELRPLPAKGWAEMIRKVYEVDPMVCPQCGGKMRVIAFLTDYAVVDRIIDHLKLTFIAERPPPPQIAYQELLMAAETSTEYLS